MPIVTSPPQCLPHKHPRHILAIVKQLQEAANDQEDPARPGCCSNGVPKVRADRR